MSVSRVRHDVCGVLFVMDIQFQPADSAMQHMIQPDDTFRVYLTRASLDPIVLTGSDVLKIIGIHMCQADVTLSLAERIVRSEVRVLSAPRKRLLGQHKPLRGR